MYKNITFVDVNRNFDVSKHIVQNALKTGKSAFPPTTLGIRLVEAAMKGGR